MNAALVLGIDTQTWRVGTAMILAFCGAVGWMLAGTIVTDSPRPATGRHRGGRRAPRSAQVAARQHRAARRSRHAQPDVFDRVLAAWATPHAALTDSVLPFVPAPYYRDIDDWLTDLPTQELPVIVEPPVEPPRHTSPTQAAADDWPPIFTRLAADWRYDREHGFDGLVAA